MAPVPVLVILTLQVPLGSPVYKSVILIQGNDPPVAASSSAWSRLRKGRQHSNFWTLYSSMKLRMRKTIMKSRYSKVIQSLKKSLLRTSDRLLIAQFQNKKVKMKVKKIRLCKEKQVIPKRHLR